MKRIHAASAIVLASALAGCGVDSMSAAATAAALKQKEIEAGQKTKAEAEQKIGQAIEQMQQNVQKSGEADK